MVDEHRQVSIGSSWQLTWELFGQTKKTLFPVAFFVVFLPVMVLKGLLSLASIPVCEGIKVFTAAASVSRAAPNYYELFSQFSTFVFTYTGVALLVVVLASIAYFAVGKIAIEQQLNHRLLPPGLSIRAGIALFIGKGVIALIFVVLFLIEQIFLGPFHIFTIFALIAPILIINEKQSIYTSIKNSLFFKYTSPQTGGAFLSAFILLALSIMFYLGENLLYLIFHFILYADEFINVPRYWWLTKLPGLPFSLVYVIADSIYTAGYILLGIFLALFTNCLFFQVRLKISERY